MKSFDVIIAGRGITGLSTAWHLRNLGITNVCLIAPDRATDNCSSLCPGYAATTLHDNITRAVHAQGSHLAKDLLFVNTRGFVDLLDFVAAHKIAHRTGEIIRFADSPLEADELSKAARWLQNNGYPASIHKVQGRASQRDGAASASLNAQELLDQLEHNAAATIVRHSVRNITTGAGGVKARLDNGDEILGEMLIAANHAQIKTLIPDLEASLVNHADQWMEFGIKNGTPPLQPGDLAFTAHSQFWISYSHKETIRAGGARFLRKWAGVEATSAPAIENITHAVKKKIETLFDLTLSDPIRAHGVLDIRACDEIPIIGPMYGDSRILLASGYMGSGLTLGFAAGRGLAEFVAHGHSKLIPREFHPNRLRSLSESE